MPSPNSSRAVKRITTQKRTTITLSQHMRLCHKEQTNFRIIASNIVSTKSCFVFTVYNEQRATTIASCYDLIRFSKLRSQISSYFKRSSICAPNEGPSQLTYLWPSSCAPVWMLAYSPNSKLIETRRLFWQTAAMFARPKRQHGYTLSPTRRAALQDCSTRSGKR